MPETIHLTIDGMTCDHCVRAVTEALTGVEGVAEATVDLDAKSATISGDGVDVAAMVAAVEEEGYEAAQRESA